MKQRSPLLLMALICLLAISFTAITVSRYSTEQTAPPFDLSLKPREYEPISITYHNTEAYTLHEDGTLEIKDYFCVEDPDTAPLMKWYETVAIADAGFTNQKIDGTDRYPDASSVKALVIPGTVKAIGATAFMTYNLESIQLAEGVESISVFAFANLGTLTNFYLPKSLTSFSGIQNPFSLQSYTVHSDNPNFYAKDGVLFNKTTNVLIQFPCKWGTANNTSVYTVPEGTTGIQVNAFSNHDIVAIVTSLKSSGTTGNWGSNKLIAIDNQLGAEITAATQANGIYTLTTTLPDSYTDPHVAITNTVAATYSAPVVDNTLTVYPDWYGDTCRITLGTNTHYGYAILDSAGNLKLYNRSEIVSGGTLYALPNYNAPTDSNAWTALDKTAVTTVEAVDAMIPGAMNGWFSGLTNCLRMDLTKLDTRSCTDMAALFQSCARLNSIFVGSKWDVSSVASSDDMFTSCATAVSGHMGVYEFALMGGSGTYFDGSSTDKTLAVIDGKDGKPGLLTDGENPRGYAVYCADQNAMLFFRNTAKPIPGESLTLVDKSYTVSEVFEGIENIDYYLGDDDMLLPEWTMEAFGAITTPGATARVQSITEVIVAEKIYPRSLIAWFAAFASITELDLENIQLDNVTNMILMFEMTPSLVTLRMPKELGPNITSLDALFAQNVMETGITSSLTKIYNIESWDTSNVTSLSGIFQGCSALTHLDLSQWKIDLSYVGAGEDLFNGCSSLIYLRLFETDLTKGWTDYSYNNMFKDCSSLEELDLSSFRSTDAKVLPFVDCFKGMTSLKTIKLPAFKFIPYTYDDAGNTIDDPAPLPPFTTDVSWYTDIGEVFTGAGVLTGTYVGYDQFHRTGATTYYLGTPLTVITDGNFTATITLGAYNTGYVITLAGDSVPEDLTVTVNGEPKDISYLDGNAIAIWGDYFKKGDVIHIAAADSSLSDHIKDNITDNGTGNALTIESGSFTLTGDDLNPYPSTPLELSIGHDVALTGDTMNISNANVTIIGATFENLPIFTGSNTTIRLVDCTFADATTPISLQIGSGVELILASETGDVIEAPSLEVSGEGSFVLRGYAIEASSVTLHNAGTIQNSRFTNSVTITAADTVLMESVEFSGSCTELVVGENTSLNLKNSNLNAHTLQLGSGASVNMDGVTASDTFTKIVGGDNASVTITDSTLDSSPLELEGTIALTIYTPINGGLVANSGAVITINTGTYNTFKVTNGATLNVNKIVDGPTAPIISALTVEDGGTLVMSEGMKQVANDDGTYQVVEDIPEASEA